jgi:hypothetical protein
LFVVEQGGPVGGVMLNLDKTDEASFKHHDRRIGDRGWKFMYDFPDHNAYHSIYEMQAVMGAHGLFGQLDTEMAQRIVKWVMVSFEKMTIQTKTVRSGLFTGWRCTSWINTVLNNVYISCAVKSFERMYGYYPIQVYEGTGDDVDMTLCDSRDAYRFYEIMGFMGYEENEIKQMVTDTKHEFMRLIYTKDRVLGCINRALPAFVCGDLERTGADAVETLRSGHVNAALLQRRGLDPGVCKALEMCICARWGRYKSTIEGEYIPISKCVLHSSELDGGMGIPDEEGQIWRLKDPVPKVTRDAVNVTAKHYNMTRDAIVRKLGEFDELDIPYEFDEQKIREMAVDSYDTAAIDRALVSHYDSPEYNKYWTHESDVISKEKLNDETDISLLSDWLNDECRKEVDTSDKRIVHFDQLSTLMKFSTLRKEDLAERLCGSEEDILGAANLKIDIRAANLVPEFAYSSISKYCKHKVLKRVWTVEEAQSKAIILINTYKDIFPHML